MAIPAYLWLKDDGGADIRGSVDIAGREGSIEIIALNHGVMLTTDEETGKPAGFASEGCIIMSQATRCRILRETRTPEVVR